MGLPTQFDKKQSNQWQEIIERKRLKALAEGVPKYKYMLEAVSNLIRSYQIGEAISPFQTDNVGFTGLIQ